MIIDTDVLIWELRGNLRAKEAVHQNIPFAISVVTYCELVQRMRNRQELNKFIRQLAKWNTRIIQINNNISTRAMILIEDFSLSHSLQLADALIAATCISTGEPLLTANEKHYKPIPNLQLKKFTP